MFQPPENSYRVGSRWVVFDYSRGFIEIWENVAKPEWLADYQVTLKISKEGEEPSWFMCNEELWVACAYFWHDLSVEENYEVR